MNYPCTSELSKINVERNRDSKPRILFLTFDVDYINPSRQQVKKAICDSCDVTLFGPGHSGWGDVEAGPSEFFERHGPFDIIIGDENSLIPPPKSVEELPRRSFLNHACCFDRSLIWKGAAYYQFLMMCGAKRVISLMQSDFYNIQPETIERMEQIGDYFMLWGEEFILPRQGADPEKMLPDGVNKKIYSTWTDRYLDFLQRNSSRIISTPMLVGMHEFCECRLAERPHDWSVLGSGYDAREKVKERLDKAGISRSGKLIPYATVATGYMGINIYAHHWSLAVFNRLFRRALQKSRFSFTCGSITKYAVRKFFEIPASGCVLVTDGCKGFSNLGFEDKKNALICKPEEILDAHDWLTTNPEKAQQIADNGRFLIQKTHSIPARGEQLDKAFQRIHENRFKGNYWLNGELVFR